MTIERWSDPALVPEITRLLHAAYAPLAEAGMHYLASHQDDATTLQRLSKGEAYLALDGERIVGTIALSAPGQQDHCELFSRPGTCVFHQFGVLPGRQDEGIGDLLLNHIEQRAIGMGATCLACDTSENATRLIGMYLRRGFERMGTVDWEVTNYRSVLLAKQLVRS